MPAPPETSFTRLDTRQLAACLTHLPVILRRSQRPPVQQVGRYPRVPHLQQQPAVPADERGAGGGGGGGGGGVSHPHIVCMPRATCLDARLSQGGVSGFNQ